VASKPKATRATWSRSTREPDRARPGNSEFRRATTDSGRPLDSLAREAIDRCAELISLAGYSPMESAERFWLGCDRVHAAAGGRANPIPADIDLNAHVLTLWSQERDYLLPDGQWRPLPASGPAPSIEALVNMVGRGLILKKVLADLLSNGSLRREGRLYLPSDSWVAHPSNSPSLSMEAESIVGVRDDTRRILFSPYGTKPMSPLVEKLDIDLNAIDRFVAHHLGD
jgi:hypothetical protein